jgi:hypothetical protein
MGIAGPCRSTSPGYNAISPSEGGRVAADKMSRSCAMHDRAMIYWTYRSFRGFWSAVWRALLDTDRINEVRWNLPLAVSLRGHKRASDNALQTRRRLSGRY